MALIMMRQKICKLDFIKANLMESTSRVSLMQSVVLTWREVNGLVWMFAWRKVLKLGASGILIIRHMVHF
ncbi:hypothetical protein D9M71_655560 [compost metagenome]